MDRRHFLLTAGAAAAMTTARAQERRERVALIGSGWWGMNILTTALANGHTDAVALCDVDQNQLDKALAKVEELTGKRPAAYRDYRELLAAAQADVAIVATPDHWHALPAIAAVEAGCHVYVEKPVSHTLLEGRAMVAAARRHGKAMQVGTHRRVSPHNLSAMQFLREGHLGEIGMVRCFVHSRGGGERPQDNEPPPNGLDWDFWCGPAPLRPYNRRIHPRGFRQFLDYANGQLGDWGIHWLDQVLWWSEEQWPRTVFAAGGRKLTGAPVNDGRQQTSDAPDSMVVTYGFESFTCTWEHRQFAGNDAEKHNLGVYFYGTRGTLHLGWQDGWTFYPARNRDDARHEDARLNQPDGQNIAELWADLLHSIQTGEPAACDIEHGHRASSLCHLGMMSLKLGRSLSWDGQAERCVGDDEANGLLQRAYRGPWQYPV